MTDFREATVNIGCIGLVTISVYKDGYWNMILELKRDGKVYLRSEDHALGRGQFINVDDPLNPYVIELEDWIWDCLMDKVGELNLAWLRNALHTPEVKDAVA